MFFVFTQARLSNFLELRVLPICPADETGALFNPLPGLNNSPESKHLKAFSPKKCQNRARNLQKTNGVFIVMHS